MSRQHHTPDTRKIETATSSDEEDVISSGGSPTVEKTDAEVDPVAIDEPDGDLDATDEATPEAVLAQVEEKPRLDIDAVSNILERRTSEATILAESFRDPGTSFYEICPSTTRPACDRSRDEGEACPHTHFVIRSFPQTETSLGDCSYLSTCHHHDTCRYVHYELETPPAHQAAEAEKLRHKRLYNAKFRTETQSTRDLLPPQWLDCDLRKLDTTVLGKFDVIMADPPWDMSCIVISKQSCRLIAGFSMTLPYGTMTDDEMKAMPLAQLQNDGGLLFLWVTGRATELGRECLKVWGYNTLDEIVWIKTNQLGRLIRTGRTGHWLNHSKEHCIVAYKQPVSPTPAQRCIDACLLWANRGVDTDVIVAEVRETSRKPDEIYSLIERIAPGRNKRRLELFGRKHNTRPGWLTLGNQLGDTRIYEQDVVARLNARYPDAPLHAATLPEAYSR